MVVCLVSLGVTDYSWEIVGMDFVTELTTSSEFHLTTILDCCLPSDMAHFLLCHKKSPLNKAMTLFIDHCSRLHGVP
jgi:hypothetical protein